MDNLNGNSRWNDATKMEMDKINEYQVFIEHQYSGQVKALEIAFFLHNQKEHNKSFQ